MLAKTARVRLVERAADVTADFAQKSLERQQKLLKIEGTSQKSLQEAEQTLAAARTQQALLQVQSPLGGVVSKVNTKAGEAADLTTVLAEVVDLDRLVVSANVPSAELAQLQVGQPAEVVPADSTNVLTTSLIFASSQVDVKTGAGLVRVALPVNSGLSTDIEFLKKKAPEVEEQIGKVKGVVDTKNGWYGRLLRCGGESAHLDHYHDLRNDRRLWIAGARNVCSGNRLHPGWQENHLPTQVRSRLDSPFHADEFEPIVLRRVKAGEMMIHLPVYVNAALPSATQ